MQKLKSLLLLLVLSVIPFAIVMYIWYSMPKNIELEGLFYLFCIPGLIFPIMLFIVLSFNFLRRKFGFERLHFLVVLIVPLAINLVSTNWAFITIWVNRTSYINEYKGLDPEYSMVEGRLVTPDTSVPNTHAINWHSIWYHYTLEIENKTEETYTDVEYRFTIADGNWDPSSPTTLGSNYESLTILPGMNRFELEMIISQYALRCDYVESPTPLALVITQSVLNEDTVTTIPLGDGLTEDFIEVAEELRDGTASGRYDLDECFAD